MKRGCGMLKREIWETGRHNGELGELRNQDAERPFERLQDWEMSIGCREENYIHTAPFWALGKGQWEVRSCEPCFWGLKGNIATVRQGLSCPPSPPGWYFHLVKGRFSMVMELACTIELKSCAVGSLVGGGAILASYVLREVPDRYPDPPDGGLGVGLGSPPRIISVISEPRQRGGAMARKRAEVLGGREEWDDNNFSETTLCFLSFREWIRRHFLQSVGRSSSIDVVTRNGVDGPGIESRSGPEFPHLSRPVLGPTPPPVQ
jgi:hypothetical protein